jgi:predicted ATPase/DNA-binding winged helix-turn-helix (wHTH) protein
MTPGAHVMSACYRFGPFFLDTQHRRLRRGSTPVRVTSKAFDLLAVLVDARDRVVSRNEIFDRLWPDTAVEDNNLSQQVHRIRRALGTDERGGSPIATIPGRGFRFLWPVEPQDQPDAFPWPAADRVDAQPDVEGSRWPALLDQLVGRADDIERVQALVREHPFVTLSGPGGVGKTRLAATAGWRLREDLSDGAYWIDLTRATRPDDLVALAAEAVGLADAGGRAPILRLREWLAERDALLVFDNFEHILDAAPLLLQLQSPASTLRFLVTSRVLLGVRGEREYVVPPLSWQGTPTAGGVDSYRETPAVRLFLDRYGMQSGSTQTDALDPREIAALCARLDGLPLAIELAAARTRLVPPADLLSRQRLAAFLPHALRDVPAHQQSVIRSIAWSYDLLDPVSRQALRTLSVFTGGFSAQAGAEVLSSTRTTDDEAAAYDAIDRLRQHSLLTFDGHEPTARLRMLETVREFCQELGTSDDDTPARRAHAAWVCREFDEAAEALRSADHVRTMERLIPDHANLLTALRWSADAHEDAALAALASAGSPFWHTANLFREGCEWLDLAIARTSDDRTPAHAASADLLAGSALMRFHAGLWAECRARVDALSAADAGTSATVLALCLDAGLMAYGGDPATASLNSQRALAAANALGEPWLVALAGVFDAFASSLLGDHDAAYRRLVGTPRNIGFLDLLIDVNQAFQALLIGRLEEAATLFGSRLHQRYGSYIPVRQIAGAIEGLGYVSERRGEMRTAALLLAAADRLRSATAPLSPVWFAEHDRAVASVRAAFGDRFDHVWAEGASLSLDETCALAAQTARPRVT